MPMEKKKLIRREIFDEVSAHLKESEITLITGSRQVGKTVLLFQLKDYLLKEKNILPNSILFYNLDIISDWELFQDQTEFIEFIRERSEKKRIYVFVDEAQKVPDAARFFKGVFDSGLNAKFILTGSSSLEIKAKFKETLSGRKMVFHLPTFTFFEFLEYKDKYLLSLLKKKRKISQINLKKIFKFYHEYIIFGGYPRVVISSSQEGKRNILNEIYSSYIEKDAVSFFEIKNKTAFNRLLKLLSAQIGQLVNIFELSLNLGIDRETVERYIQVLEETFIIKKITPYFRNSRQEIIKSNKIYFLDLGIRNLVLENFNSLEERIDKGSLLENAILCELFFRTRNNLGQTHFWRTKQKAEVDFVIEKGLNLLPIEVKYKLGKRKVHSGMINFIKKFNLKRGIIINCSFGESSINRDKTKISFLFPFDIFKLNGLLK